ncbi:MAG: hypothetical protein J5I90_09140 [Caldilineales bacterium]|nr:hypothetical protein [Caldilineales bacterium]
MPLAISLIDVILSFIFTLLVLRQWYARRKTYQLVWAFALLVWTIAVAAEAVATLQGGWTATTYRIYYAFGALMVAPWLGVGSLFLVAPRRVSQICLALVLGLSLVGVFLIYSFAIDPAALTHTDMLGFVEVKVFPFVPVRMLIVIGNIFGTIAFVGSAFYSVWAFWRAKLSRERMMGVLLIAIGGLVAASAHSIGALGGPGLFRVSELAAISLIFAGYLLSTAPARRQVAVEATAPS